MTQDNEKLQDNSGFGWILINLVALAWVTMPVSIVLIKVVQW
ncbi:MAG: hypothetical protein SVU24_00135 [Pseudomonadota bacterium]|jgi:hypothetical protein|nr:hypothetical protein [Pseudomonadota bacterium]